MKILMLISLLLSLAACSTVDMSDIGEGLARYNKQLEYEQEQYEKQQAFNRDVYYRQLEEQRKAEASKDHQHYICHKDEDELYCHETTHHD